MKGKNEVVEIWHGVRQQWGIFSLRMRRNGYVRASGQKSDTFHSLLPPLFATIG